MIPYRRRLRRLAGALAFLAAFCLAARAGQARPFTARDLVTLDRASDPQAAPNGRMLVFTLRRVDLATDRAVDTIARIDLTQRGARPAVLQASLKGASMPRWSSDGRAIYFLSDRGGSNQLWRVPATGGPAVQVTRLPLDIISYRLSPDGHAVVVSMSVFPDRTESPQATATRLAARRTDKATGTVYDHLFARPWDAWADGRRNHLFALLLDPSGAVAGSARPLMAGFDGDVPSKPFGDDADFIISPNGRDVFFSARLAGGSEPWSTHSDVYRVPINGAQPPSDLTRGNTVTETGPVLSPKGTQLAFRTTRRPGSETGRFGVVVMDLRSGAMHEVDPDWDRSAGSLAWSQNGKTLYLTAADTGQTRLFAMDAATGQVRGLTANGHVRGVALVKDDILFFRDSLDGPAQLWRVPASGGTAVQLTHVDADRLAGISMAKADLFSFPGWNNETVHGTVLEPAAFKPGRKYPVVLLIHGGPLGSFGNQWSDRWNPQTYAGRGYAAVMIDFHGSTGYGQAFADSISGHWGDRPLEDLQKGWAYALAHFDFLDGDRACALGGGYGGFMVNWIAGVWNAPWKCLVTYDGMFDDRMMGYSTDELWFSEWEHGGAGHTPWSDSAAYERFNPAAHVAEWKVPQLVIQGVRGDRIPLEQGLATFGALQRRGIESRLLVFPDENHGVLGPADSLLWHATVEAWLHEHLER